MLFHTPDFRQIKRKELQFLYWSQLTTQLIISLAWHLPARKIPVRFCTVILRSFKDLIPMTPREGNPAPSSVP
jgi:hypothetical protein